MDRELLHTAHIVTTKIVPDVSRTVFLLLGNLMLTFGQFLTIAKTTSLQSTSWYVLPLFRC